MQKKLYFSSTIIPGLVSLAMLFASQTLLASDNVVNIYSARKEALVLPLLERFKASTGIEFNLVTGKADGLLKRLQLEGKGSPADLFITVDAGRLQRAKQAGVLQPHQSDSLTSLIPRHLRDEDGFWVGLSQRARTIIYAVDRVSVAELSSYEGLVDEKWKGRICVRSSNNIYNQSLVASLLEAHGEAMTQTWVEGLVANFARPPAGGDTDQIKAVAAGVCDIAIVNTYYFGRLVSSKKDEDKQLVANLRIFWPNQEDRGVHVNVSGAGLTKHAPHRSQALQLLEFLATPESQIFYAEVNNEYPVIDDVPISDVLISFGEFKSDRVNLTRLGEKNRTAVEIMDRAGWR
ncbi:MAG: iron(III) transport system substrate-binding protein [Gammaproteobacteria bacterium]|jgi:iron(III) transport system substrate-binding protein